jgi:hypothetical protein
MLGAIPNPKKSIEIDFSIDKITSTIEYIPLKNSKYKFTSKNEVLKTYRFEALEFLSLGVYIDISLSSISDTKSKIDIEVLRKVGAFDKTYEVSKANEHITAIATLISECIVLTAEEIQNLEEQRKNKAQTANKGCGKSAAAILLIITAGVSTILLL